GEKQLSDTPKNINKKINNNTPESMGLQQNNKKTAKNREEKYCTACNREMSTRHYYEFHMLNVHDVLLSSSSKTLIVDLLERMSSTRKQQLTFRCDSCCGRCIDYDNFEELQQQQTLRNHGMRAHPKLARAVTIGRDKSVPLPPGGLRRSARIPKPTSAIIHSLLLAKDDTDFEGGEQTKVKESNKSENNTNHQRSQILQGLKDEEAREDAELDDCIKGIKRRWGGTKSKNKLDKINIENNEEESLQNKDNYQSNETKVVQEEEPFVTILNDGRIEVEETQAKKARNMREKRLDPADSMLMALASAALMEKVQEYSNASAKANNINNNIINNSFNNPPTTTSNHLSSYPSSTSSDLILNSLNSTTTISTTKLSSFQSTNNKIKGIFREKKISATKIDKKQKKNKEDKQEGNNKIKNNVDNIPQQQNNSETVFHVEEGQQQLVTQNLDNIAVEFPRDSASIDNNTNNSIIIPASSPFFTLSNGQNQAAMFVSQDDSTWFGHSIAAQLRLMPLHIKELAKMRIQQVIFECNSTSFASFHQFAQLQPKLVKPQNSSSNDSPTATNLTEQNGIEQTLEINGESEERVEENNEEVDVVTVEEMQQKQNNETT
uniref:C2H2-type domain-containing protein n=1 Tax=Meloidogyne hapla TaxID=6305 RepID=A0A1I8BC24_MELHA